MPLPRVTMPPGQSRLSRDKGQQFSTCRSRRSGAPASTSLTSVCEQCGVKEPREKRLPHLPVARGNLQGLLSRPYFCTYLPWAPREQRAVTVRYIKLPPGVVHLRRALRRMPATNLYSVSLNDVCEKKWAARA